MFGWFKSKKEEPFILEDIPTTKENAQHIIIQEDRKAPPAEMKRKYIVGLLDGRRMEVELYNANVGDGRIGSIFLYGRSEEGESAKWLIIDMTRLPTDLLNPNIISLIKNYYSEIKALDKAYVETGMNEYVDRNGVKWVKADK